MYEESYYQNIFAKYGGMMRTQQLEKEKIFYKIVFRVPENLDITGGSGILVFAGYKLATFILCDFSVFPSAIVYLPISGRYAPMGSGIWLPKRRKKEK